MGIMVKKKMATVIKQNPEVFVPPAPRKDKVNLDPYYQKAIAGSKKKKGEDMAVKAKVKHITATKKETSKRGAVTQTWIKVLEASNGKTDVQLAAEMVKAGVGHTKYTEAHVKSVRSLYNLGKLVGQKGKPAKELVEHKSK